MRIRELLVSTIMLVIGGVQIAKAQSGLDPKADSTMNFNQVVYQCERGIELPVIFLPNNATMYIDGHLVLLKKQTPGESGTTYISVDEQNGYRLKTNGDLAVITWLASDDEAVEQTILKDCAIPEDGDNN